MFLHKRCAVSAVLKFRPESISKRSLTTSTAPLRAVVHATKATSGLLFLSRGLRVTPPADVTYSDSCPILLHTNSANMDSEPPTSSVQTQDKFDNPSLPQRANTLENETQDTLSAYSQECGEPSENHAELNDISKNNNEGHTASEIYKERPILTENDSVQDTPSQDEAQVKSSSDKRSNLEPQINQITPQTSSKQDHSPQASPPTSSSLNESVSNVDEQVLSTTEKADQLQATIDKDYHEIKTSNQDDGQINHENSLPINLPKTTDAESPSVNPKEVTGDLLWHSDNVQSKISLTKSTNLLPTTNKNFAESSQSSSTDYGNQPNTGRSIKSLFSRTSSDQDNSLAGDLEDKEDTAGDILNGDLEEGDVVLVTGGCGFLGQHIVKLLHLRAPHVAEVRVLDLNYFERKLDYQPTKRFKSLVGDISNSEFLNKALKGVNSVIHVAGVVSWGTFPDLEGMEKVNVKGTLNVVKACLKNNVQRLVYCSTVDVAVGSKPILGGTEEDTPIPDKFLFNGYPETKYHGERIVQGVGQYKRDDGGNLQTIILRPNVLYGELDKYYVTTALRKAHQSMGIMYRIGNGKAMFQQAYVGNAAWAFICADVAMRTNPELTKQIFYIPDNTPVQNSFNFLVPYLEAHGLKLSTGYLSYALSHSAVAAAEILARALSPVVKLNLPFQSSTIAYINTDLYFRGDKAKELLNYEPIYTSNEAREMSMQYYANIDLEEQPKQK